MLKRMKRLLRLRNKSGFTLVEVIIACALLGILVVGVLGFATPVLKNIREKEQNARALMLSEAIDSYIANSIQYAFYVQPVSNVASGDTVSVSGDPAVMSWKYVGTEFEKYKDKGLSDLLNCFKNDLAGDVFEIKCIGIRWVDVPGTGTKKLMVTNEKVNQTTCALDPAKAQMVFDPIFYDGLYPIIKLENYSNQYQIKGADGKPVDQVKPENVDIAPGIKITTDVYLTPDCYAVKENVRNSAIMTLTGTTYATLNNIGSNLLNRGVYKNQPRIDLHTVNSGGVMVPSYPAAYTADSTAAYLDDDGNRYYYSNTFIYYIARKTKTGSDPATPAPTP